MHYDRPIVLSIAGMDPSGGAGVLADVKTLEQHRCLGLGVLSAWTIQTENTFDAVSWLSAGQVIAQMEPLLEQYPIKAVKIGIVQDLPVLLRLLQWLRLQRPGMAVVWDPVLTASAGYELAGSMDESILLQVLERVSLVTPNTTEARRLACMAEEHPAAAWLARYCPVLLKGGHSAQTPGLDLLFENNQDQPLQYPPGSVVNTPKHGSGCILSSAIAARLASGDTLQQACLSAKTYTEKILNSNDQLLAYHHV